MKQLFDYLSRTFVYALAGGLFSILAIEGLLKREIGIFGWKFMRAIVGDGLQIYSLENDPVQYWTLTLFYSIFGIILWVVFIAKSATKREKSKYDNFLT